MPVLQVRNVKELISSSIAEDFDVISQHQKLLTAPGEHYGSIMLAVDLKIKKTTKRYEEDLNLVAKLIPANDVLRDMFDVQVTFKKEISAYLDAIPAMIDFQRRRGVPGTKILDIFPKCYGGRINLNNNNGSVDEDAAIMLENLKIQGYVTGDRFGGFDLMHAELIVKDLAKFHAVPVAMRKLEPRLFEEKIRPCIVKNGGVDNVPEELTVSFFNSILIGARLVPELEPFLEKLQKVVDNAAEYESNEKTPSEMYATITHADYWVNNTMILHDKNGNPIKNKIVDLQIMQYDSGLCDLVFFLFTSVDNGVLDANYEYLLRSYNDTFVEYLKDMGVDTTAYTWQAFLEELDNVGPREVHHVGFMLKPIFTEKGSVKSFEDFDVNDWCRSDLLGSAYRKKLKDTIFAFAERNWI